MAKPSTWILEYARNVHSQNGEDGVLEKIIQLLPETDQWCVEFGAWDGRFLTNTRHLIERRGYSAVLIECDRHRFQDLVKNYSDCPAVIPINAAVGHSPSDGLDHILTATPIPLDFDVLSIDIDGNDFHVWKAMTKYRPKVVVIEFNPTIPTEVDFVQAADPRVSHGSSLSALVRLGREKGYELVCVLLINAIFVRREDFARFEIESNAPSVLRTDLGAVTYFFSGYDGTVFLRGNSRMPWHGIKISESRVQQLPRYFRQSPESYSWMQRLLFRWCRKIARGWIKLLHSQR